MIIRVLLYGLRREKRQIEMFFSAAIFERSNEECIKLEKLKSWRGGVVLVESIIV